MSNTNRPVTSREYKLMLQVDRFADRDRGTKGLWRLVDFLADRNGGKAVLEDKKPEERRTWYLDTSELSLRRRGWVVRVRKETDEGKDRYKVTLKYRAADRYLSAARDLSCTRKADLKFEEDIIPPFASKFSHSAATKFKSEPEFTKFKDLVDLFPGLKSIGVTGNPKINPVRSFRAHEIAHKIGLLDFPSRTKVKACLSFWYMLEEPREWPLVTEFSFDFDAAETDGDRLEEFPTRLVEHTNGFFHSLRAQSGWIDLKSTTKTAYAYTAL